MSEENIYVKSEWTKGLKGPYGQHGQRMPLSIVSILSIGSILSMSSCEQCGAGLLLIFLVKRFFLKKVDTRQHIPAHPCLSKL